MDPTELLSEIDAFLAECGMSERTFGFQAANNFALVPRLRAAKAEGRKARIWPETADEVRSYIRSVRQGAPKTQRRRKRAVLEAAE